MKYFFSIVCATLWVANSYAISIKVLLSETVKASWQLSSETGFYIQDPFSQKRTFFESITQKITITSSGRALAVNGKVIPKKNFYIKPIKGHSHFDGDHYDGFFLLSKHKNRWHLINVIDSEEYVFSVLKAESWPGWPIEVNKAFAVASRSYVLHQLIRSSRQRLPYHIKNTNHHQCYNGVHSCKIIRQAIKETEGVFLSHEGEPILAMFDICCGGIIPSKVNGVVDFKKAPYLARKYPCTFCKNCKSYSWQVEYSLAELRDSLQNGVEGFLHDLKEFKVEHKDRAGVVQNVIVKTKSSEVSFTVHEVYKLLKEVKSFAFSVKKNSRKVVLKGKGFGHHIGLCQWGAREMVKRGKTFDSILKFYYPGTKFMKVDQLIRT